VKKLRTIVLATLIIYLPLEPVFRDYSDTYIYFAGFVISGLLVCGFCYGMKKIFFPFHNKELPQDQKQKQEIVEQFTDQFLERSSIIIIARVFIFLIEREMMILLIN
jgi:hypothetical protein